MASTILKVKLFADGGLLLDGKPVTLSEIAAAMDAAPQGESVVWYYRENAGGEAPAVTGQLVKLITERRLPVRLSTKPDFSDSVQPGAAGAVVEQMFAVIRKSAAERHLVILRPDGKQLKLPALAKAAVSPEQIAAIERLLPSSVQRRIAVIGETSWALAQQPGIQDAARAIPFFGMLMGLAAVGHAVWIFDGSTPTVLAAGCRDADLVIVDGEKLKTLPANWHSLAAAGPRKAQILAHDRATFQLRQLV
jgi:hypothetical protein